MLLYFLGLLGISGTLLFLMLIKKKFIDLKINRLKPPIITKYDIIKNVKHESDIILVTGANGQVGRSIVEELHKDNRYSKIRFFDVMKTWDPGDDVEIMIGDITNEHDIFNAINGCKVVVHCAAMIELRNNISTENRMYNTNVVGTANVINACVKYGIDALVYISTASILIDENYKKTKIFREQDINQIEKPSIFYSWTKLEAEKLVLAANGTNNLKTISLRPPGIFGPYDSLIVLPMTKGIRPPPLFLNKAEYSNIANIHSFSLARACILSIKQLLLNNKKVCGRFYFISDFNCNFIYFYNGLAKVIGIAPRNYSFGVFLNPLIKISQFVDWITGGNVHHPFVSMFNKNTIKIIKMPIELDTTDAQKDLDFTPLTFQEAMDITADSLGKKRIQF